MALPDDDQPRRPRAAPSRRGTPPSGGARWLGRLAAVGALAAFLIVFAVIVLGGGKTSPSHPATSVASTTAPPRTTTPRTVVTPAAVPILAYHVINDHPPGSSAPASLYVPASEFTAQMQALKSAGWRAITLDQLPDYWSGKLKLGSSKPIVITFDGGYASQFATALPVLRGLGWVGVIDIPVQGLASSEGGLLDSQVKALMSAGWEVDLQGTAQTNLISLGSASAVSQEVTTERQSLQARVGGAVNWYAYANGTYDANVTAGLHSAGLAGGLTLVPGWASPRGDRTRLPRLAVVGGTTPAALQSQIAGAEHDPAPGVSGG
jgi:peptidoglycan/xylan/chitin deacetylase (PgdA/CDA1 family)